MQPEADDPGPEPPQDNETAPVSLAEELAERLARADALQARADEMTAAIAELEVAGIEAGMRPVARPEGMSPDDVIAVGDLLARRRELRRQVAGFGKPASPGHDQKQLLRRLNEAREALDLWLDPPAVDESRIAAHGARIVLLIATRGAFWGAYVWHPAVLLLLIPVAAPIGLLLNRGDDKVWRRLGARRNFERTGLPAPADWSLEPVRARREALVEEQRALANRLDAQAGRAAQADEDRDEASLDEDFAELQLELVETEHRLAGRARRHELDLDDDDAPDLAVFHEAASVARAARALDNLTRERARIQAESAEIRDGIWRALREAGVTTEEGSATSGALHTAVRKLLIRQGVTLH